jgi:branched-chain amino acid transport system substrate-binding protein
VAPFVKTSTSRFGIGPSDYAMTAYDGTLVILDAIRRVAPTGQPVTRALERDATPNASAKTLQRRVSFDTKAT